MSNTYNKDLLTSTLQFNKLQDIVSSRKPYKIIEEVSSGRITLINDHFQHLQKINQESEIIRLVNSMDMEGKTPLFYACYYNFQNLIVYLLTKGSDPFIITSSGQNLFHLCCYLGHSECISLVLNYCKHIDRLKLFQNIKQEMKQYYFKRTDIRQGILISSDKHNPLVKERFNNFRHQIYVLFKKYLELQLDRITQALKPIDDLSRNPIHYAALSKFTKCIKSARLLLNYGLNIDGYDDFEYLFNEIQLLELNKENRICPKQYLPIIQMVTNFLLPHEYNELLTQFKQNIDDLVQKIINGQDNEGYTPLHLASFYGDFAQVQFYLKLGADPKAVDLKHRKEVLDYASNDTVRKYLIDLKDATKQGDNKSFNFLVNCGHFVDGKKTIFGIAPIHNAVQNVYLTKDDTILKNVVKCDADINITDSNGWTSLHHASKNGDLATVQYLISEKSDINKFSNKGYQPIHIAAMYNHPDVLQFLLDNNANIQALTVDKLTPLHLASKKGNIQVMKVLLDNKANIYAVDDKQWTCLHFAAFNYHYTAVQLLQRYDADYEKLKYMINSKGKTALQIVTNDKTRFAFYTLWNASREGNLDIVRRLTTLGQDLNEQTFYNKITPLIFATLNEHYLIVKFLLENGANKDITNIDGKTALDYAYTINNRKIIKLLDSSVN
ncbi:hypothetical protein IMG5_033560 [Ichthyophthirius multifiliis]|uniref:Ankyrin repeat protein n=1 Tax=Ichthyophthirius multifiliis TaxID=5932 RepID=G0QLN1_ICHMU|nr:hypothetical protein IMG5_033560 [Ichthyophthirius multifiliis]EGR33877.1 hypothetical protein IMG5_033560 [Ichthyophthirius multifiliis]|eukprot:XP_004039101.1 hypothetical protein IMG5_033560 [Ichthyophthirius multifiliis]